MAGKLSSGEFRTIFALIKKEHVIYERSHEEQQARSFLQRLNRSVHGWVPTLHVDIEDFEQMAGPTDL